MADLTSRELVELVRSVFPRLPGDVILSILIDLPRSPDRDNPPWQDRRILAFEWMGALYDHRFEIPMDDIRLFAYPDVGSPNADFPDEAFLCGTLPPAEIKGLGQVAMRTPFEDVLAESQIIIAPTEFSATAPLKVAARKFGFRAATMPGFARSMTPALRLDYGRVARLVGAVKDRLDKAAGADILFRVDGRRECRMHFDLRDRTAQASTGRFPDPGTAGNLPSGEAYIVPNEGEDKTPSATFGDLPVEIGGEVVVYRIRANKAVSVESGGPLAAAEAEYLEREPAYGNMAELGFGVLAEFGVEPCGEILLDEKLGLHVAFGRSEHFGGRVGPGNFSSPASVVHLDRIYIPKIQPRIEVAEVVFDYAGGGDEILMKDGRYKIF